MTNPTLTTKKLVPYAKSLQGKPVLASWMGGGDIEKGEEILERANIPAFAYPDTAARMFDYMANYTAILNRMYETPNLATESDNAPDGKVRRSHYRTCAPDAPRPVTSDYESKKLLEAYHIPTVATLIAKNEDDAVNWPICGYPVVFKLQLGNHHP